MNTDIRITTAGAGSGKTTELTNLMHQGIAAKSVRPQAIIAATFVVSCMAMAMVMPMATALEVVLALSVMVALGS